MLLVLDHLNDTTSGVIWANEYVTLQLNVTVPPISVWISEGMTVTSNIDGGGGVKSIHCLSSQDLPWSFLSIISSGPGG